MNIIDGAEYGAMPPLRPERIATALTQCAEKLHQDTERITDRLSRITAAIDDLAALAQTMRGDPDEALLDELAGGRFQVVRHDKTDNPFAGFRPCYDLIDSNGCEVARGLSYAEAVEIAQFWPSQRTATTPAIHIDYAPCAGLTFDDTEGAPILRFDTAKRQEFLGTHLVWRSRGWTLLLANGEKYYIGGHLDDVDTAVARALDYLGGAVPRTPATGAFPTRLRS